MRLLLFSLLLVSALAADPAGCDGFIKFPTEEWVKHGAVHVEFSRGSERAKERVAVSPNGYYFLPVESSETGTLRVVGPKGWLFSPRERRAVCGGADHQDYDFEFEGVAVQGRVSCVGCAADEGPSGVQVGLGKHRTVTDASGSWSLDAVVPGETQLKCSRGEWTHEATVQVNYAGQVSGDAPVMAGFSVSGKCVAGNKGAEGVEITVANQKAISDASGAFVVRDVPSGKHVVTASLVRDNRHFVLTPEAIDVTVATSDVTLDTSFRVSRFLVTGKFVSAAVLARAKEVTVVVDGQERPEVEVDASDGSFALQVEEGAHVRVGAKLEGFHFEPVVFDASQHTAIPELRVSAVSLCAQLDLLPEAQVTVALDDNMHQQGGAGETLCFKVGAGTHQLRVVKGVQCDEVDSVTLAEPLAPPSEPLVVRQSRSIMQGKLELMEGVSSVQVTFAGATVAVGGEFSFPDVVPGMYTFEILDEQWCWDGHRVQQVSVPLAEPLVLRQLGAVMRQKCHPDAPSTVLVDGVLNVTLDCSTTGQSCVELPLGVHTVVPQGCFAFEPASATWDSREARPAPLFFQPTAHLISGHLRGAAKLKLHLTGGNDVEVPVQADSSFEAQVPLNDKFELECVPHSSEHLCVPARYSGVSACEPDLTFVVQAGLFVEGHVEPPTAGVNVSISCPDGSVKSVQSKADGSYRIGPLRERCDDPVGSHPSFAVTPDSTDALVLHLRALSQVRVTVEDLHGRPVSECVLSLSGPNGFRENQLSAADGTRLFSHLAPGTHYLRAMLKEYAFDPSDQTIQVESGRLSEVKFVGKRVAYSVFGSVAGLTQEPEKLVDVVATSLNGEVLSEARTDERGRFRLRGLAPKSQVRVQVRDARLEQSSPPLVPVSIEQADVSGVDFVAVRQTQRGDIAGAVMVPPQYSSNMFVELRAVGEAAVLRSANASLYFDFRNLPLNADYELHVRSDVSDRTHVHTPVVVGVSLKLPFSSSDPAVAVVNNRRLFVQVGFSLVERSSLDDAHIEGTPAIGAILFLLLVAGFVFRDFLLLRLRFYFDPKGARQQKHLAETKSKMSSKDKAASFLQGTVAKQRKRK